MANHLHHAVRGYKADRVKYLLQTGLSVNSKDSKGNTILLQALRMEDAVKRRRMVRYLLRHGADPMDTDDQNGRDALSWACALGRGAEVKTFLRVAPGEYDFQKTDHQGLTALHHAVQSMDTEVVTMIAEEMRRLWVSVDVPDSNGLTPYLLALKLGLVKIAEILRENGASRNQADSKRFQNGDCWLKCGKAER